MEHSQPNPVPAARRPARAEPAYRLMRMYHCYDSQRHTVHRSGPDDAIVVVRFIERAPTPFNPNDMFVCEHVEDGYTHIHHYVLVRRLDEWEKESGVQVWAAALNIVETLDGERLYYQAL